MESEGGHVNRVVGGEAPLGWWGLCWDLNEGTHQLRNVGKTVPGAGWVWRPGEHGAQRGEGEVQGLGDPAQVSGCYSGFSGKLRGLLSRTLPWSSCEKSRLREAGAGERRGAVHG